jgi:hypothetical protein
MMQNGITAAGLRDFDVADLDGNMLFFGRETPKS